MAGLLILAAPASAQTPGQAGRNWQAGPGAGGDNTFLGGIDSPGFGAIVAPNRLFVMSGWVADTTAQGWTGADGVQVVRGTLDNGTLLADATTGVSRPDVAAAFGNPFWAGSGWSAVVDAASLAAGPNTLSVYAHTPAKGLWVSQVQVNVSAGSTASAGGAAASPGPGSASTAANTGTGGPATASGAAVPSAPSVGPLRNTPPVTSASGAAANASAASGSTTASAAGSAAPGPGSAAAGSRGGATGAAVAAAGSGALLGGSPPLLSVSVPIPNQKISNRVAQVTLTGTASDPSGGPKAIDWVELWLDGEQNTDNAYFLGVADLASDGAWSLDFAPSNYPAITSNLYVYAHSDLTTRTTLRVVHFDIVDRPL